MIKIENKRALRVRRARRTRLKMRELGVYRLSIFRSPKHIYAQVIAPNGSEVIASASTVMKTVKEGLENKATGNVEAAKMVGKLIAERSKEKGITKVAFDRSGYKYHGRIKALADAAREHGLEF